ncbi:MAG: response regulator [Hyphomicrobium sp.]
MPFSSASRVLPNPERLESGVAARAKRMPSDPNATVYAVDDDETVLDVLGLILKSVGLQMEAYTSAGEFVEKFNPNRPGCVVLDLWMPDLNGFETMIRLRERAKTIPVVFLTGNGDVSAVVRAMRLGAVDFFEKPVNSGALLECIQHWVQQDSSINEALRRRQLTLSRLAKLSCRQREVLDCVFKGMSNKQIARHLGVSPKAIEMSRAHVMEKMEVPNVVGLILDVAGCLCRSSWASATKCLPGSSSATSEPWSACMTART